MGNSGVSPAAARHGSHSDRSGQVTTLAARPDRIGPCVVPGSARTDGRPPTIRRCSSARGCAAPHCIAALPTGLTWPECIYQGREAARRSSSVTASPTVFASRRPGPCWLPSPGTAGWRRRTSVGTADPVAVLRSVGTRRWIWMPWCAGPAIRGTAGSSSSGSRWAPPSRCGTPPWVRLRATRWSRCPHRPAGTSGRARRCAGSSGCWKARSGYWWVEGWESGWVSHGSTCRQARWRRSG